MLILNVKVRDTGGTDQSAVSGDRHQYEGREGGSGAVGCSNGRRPNSGYRLPRYLIGKVCPSSRGAHV